MQNTYWKDCIYILCCYIGDDYFNQNMEYTESAQESKYNLLSSNNNSVQNIHLRRSQSCILLNSPTSPSYGAEDINNQSTNNGLVIRKKLRWIIGDEYFKKKIMS